MILSYTTYTNNNFRCARNQSIHITPKYDTGIRKANQKPASIRSYLVHLYVCEGRRETKFSAVLCILYEISYFFRIFRTTPHFRSSFICLLRFLLFLLLLVEVYDLFSNELECFKKRISIFFGVLKFKEIQTTVSMEREKK